MTASHSKAGEKNTVRRHTPLRRAVKIVGPWRVGVSLVLGRVPPLAVLGAAVPDREKHDCAACGESWHPAPPPTRLVPGHLPRR